MCCLLAVLVFLGPRAMGLVWWLLEPARWGSAFSNDIFGILGWLFLPWTTLAWVFVASGGITGLDIGLVILGIFADFASYGGNAYKRKDLGFNY
jgi:hypothetical protein